MCRLPYVETYTHGYVCTYIGLAPDASFPEAADVHCNVKQHLKVHS
jgi:hypothetical protein